MLFYKTWTIRAINRKDWSTEFFRELYVINKLIKFINDIQFAKMQKFENKLKIKKENWTRDATERKDIDKLFPLKLAKAA